MTVLSGPPQKALAHLSARWDPAVAALCFVVSNGECPADLPVSPKVVRV